MTKPIKIIKIERQIEEKNVYDIEVPEGSNYILENGVISHNSGPQFAASIVALLNPLKLKEDEDGNKTTDVLGIRSSIKIMKSRYAQPFQKIEIKIPYESGMDAFSGLFDLFEKKKILIKEGNRYVYTSAKDPAHSFKEFRKNITHDQYMWVMQEFEEPVYRAEEIEQEDESSEEELIAV